MAKPKIVGGYELSDDEEDAPVPPPKPTKAPVPVAPAPPFRMPPPRAQNSTATRPNPPPSRPAPSHPAPPRLAPPGSIPSRPQTAASAPRPSQSALLTPRRTPNASKSNWAALDDEIATSGDDADSSSPVEPTRSKGKERIVVNEAESSQAARSGHLAHERDMHQLQRRVNEHEATISTQKKEITNLRNEVQTLKTGLDELTQTFNDYRETQTTRWTQADLAAQAAAAAPPPPVAPAPVNAPGAPAAVEPVTTPNLSFDPTQDTKSYVPVSDAKTLFNIVSTFKHRSAADKPTIPLLNKIRLLLRNSFWDSLDGVTKAEEVRQPYHDENGVHQLFPPHLADSNGHIKAYPDWEGNLENQIPFVERVIRRFRSSAAQGNDPYSVTARTMREYLIIEIMIDGVWSTCVQKWNEKAHGDGGKRVRAENKRRRQGKRKTVKSDQRASTRNELPQLAGEEHDAVFHPGMMSGDETEAEDEPELTGEVKTEGEGEGKTKRRRARKPKTVQVKVEGQPKALITMRPEMRSRYANALYDASSECIRRRRIAAQGNSFQPLETLAVVTAETTEIPDLRRDGKVLLIPLYMFSTAWRKENKTLIDANAHLINFGLKTAPNIDHFLQKYQRRSSDDEEEETPNPVSHIVRPDVGGNKEDYGFEGQEDPRRRVEQEEEWVQQAQRDANENGGLDEEDQGGQEVVGGPDEELDPRSVAKEPTNTAGTKAITRPDGIVLQEGLKSLNIDPLLFESTPPPEPAPIPPKPAHPPPQSRQPPEPMSSIRIQLCQPLTNHIPALPEPYPDVPNSPDAVEPAELSRTEPEPELEPTFQMPPDGPQHPPPPLKRMPSVAPEAVSDSPPKKRARKKNASEGPNGGTSARGASARTTRSRKKAGVN